jgi:hypothetical protein
MDEKELIAKLNGLSDPGERAFARTVADHMITYIEASRHEGTPISLEDFTLYLKVVWAGR